MKKLVVIGFILLTVSLCFAQEYWERSVQEAILADPSVSYDLNRPIESINVTQPELAPEMEFSSGRQTVKIPFAYPFGNLTVAANLPLQRITVTSNDKSKSAIGLGDAAVSGAYKSYLPEGFNGWSLDYAGDLTIKLPTGDKDKTVKIDGIAYSTAMGSGSWDFTAAGNALLTKADREIMADVKYRLNGKDEDKVKYGNLLSLKGRYGFLQFEPKFDGYLGLQAVIIGDGKSDDTDLESSMFLLDFVPELHYITGLGIFRVGFTMPLITSSETKFTREYSVRFGYSRKY